MSTEPTKANAAAAPLPLFYKKPVVLNAEQHRRSGLADSADFSFARGEIAVPLQISELALAARTYPIVFSDTPQPVALAVMGIKVGENLFIDKHGKWQENCYIPAYVRRYPFIGMTVEEKGTQILAIDAASDRFIADVSPAQEKFRLFDDQGGATELARSAIAFCDAFHQEHLQTLAYCQALQDAGLLSSNQVNIELKDGSRYRLDGFKTIDEKAFRNLPADTVVDWHKKGWLDLTVLYFIAQQNWQLSLTLNAVRQASAS